MCILPMNILARSKMLLPRLILMRTGAQELPERLFRKQS